MVNLSKCSICSNKVGIYKCSICYMPYCSVPCYKQHKKLEGNCVKPINTENEEANNNCTRRPILHPTEDTVPSDKLQQLEYNSKLKELMKNPHLRDILYMVDRTKNSATTMQKVMLEPIFMEFAEQCLKTVEDT